MAVVDLNEEWLGHVQPIGLVVAPVVLARHGLNPETQTRADTEEVRKLLSSKEEGATAKNDDLRALRDPWAFFEKILGWRTALVAGAPGGPPVPEGLSLRIDESDTEIAPHWAAVKPDGGWQILARIEAVGVNPDARGAIEGWEASPHQRLERLLRETEVPIGLLITDDELRFIYAPRGETSGWMCFPLRSLGEVGGRPMLGGLKLLLSSFRLYNDAPNRRLPALLKASRDAQAEVSTKLASQVLGALHELLRGLHATDARRVETLAATRQEHLYDGLLTVLLRLVFLLYAEDRDLIPSRTDAAARAFYDQGYGVRTLYARLLDDKAHYPDTMDERRGAWSRLLALFRLVHEGDSTGIWIRGRGGKLFDTAEFPFLQGQEQASHPPSPAAVSDGCILRILDLLLNLGGEKLSYRTLDVEQIGSVYETVMGFTIETRTGPALAIRAGKNDRTPVFVDIADLTAKKASDREKFLKEEAGRNALSDKASKALSAATNATAVVEALRPIVDERASPGGALSPPGSPLLQPTDERRRTGSHYTPRSLTAPIVEYALKPAFDRLGPDARPEEVLELTVCDPAMGSGAFLVEACRALGERLVKAWDRWPERRPIIPEDEDEQLHARRLVAQRCLYGVDKNPRAVDLAKLSLWLATLARDHEFTFLDHALKCGDSLVGLTTSQIGAANWDESKPGLPLFRQLVKDRVAEAMKARAEIQAAPDDTTRAIQEARHRGAEVRLAPIRTMGDAVISAFFAADKSKARERKRTEIESFLTGSLEAQVEKLEAAVASLRDGINPVPPFHWQIEFPEVFARANSGFDAIVGNPPFAGKNTIIRSNRMNYLPWLQALHEDAHGNADLVAHFFRRAFKLLRNNGVFGLIATNTIGQGDTRASGLTKILSGGGSILRATRRLKWPGEAAVVVSVVHVAKGGATNPVLDNRPVSRISAYLVEGDLDGSAIRLAANSRKVLIGSYPLGAGFLFDDRESKNGKCEPLAKAEALLAHSPHDAKRVRPFIGGSDLTTSPQQKSSRLIIDFRDLPLKRDQSLDSWISMSIDQRASCLRQGIVPANYPEDVCSDWPDLLAIVEKYVHPERDAQGDKSAKRKWWKFKRPNMFLYRSIADADFVIARSLTSTHFSTFARVRADQIFDQTALIFLGEPHKTLAMLCSRLHETWVDFFSGTLKDDGRYNIEDCFETFPFLPNSDSSVAIMDAGSAYDAFRAELMVARNEGLTKTYNHFHARGDNTPGIARLRELHAQIDAAILRAYGWNDLADSAAPEFIEQDSDEGKTPKTHLDWPEEFKDEVLARLLSLNAERGAAERSAGVTPVVTDDDEENEEVEA
ncbi:MULTISPECIES: Eco57I restriction-modification methylase domain-containing protein [Bradyrhizobium]|uniref:site-specific DNA-methyltransferase (adenine-specific) n=2 Tax=Bradyrhizobium TaxID=374 RepID=A0ABY0QG86_9BRAD|nr:MULTISPECIES: DNA methyltransferase [Bradyrhizobium]SDK28051.1 N-6 DNA Methylase [Bradyrhizobium ottawaense]SEE42432.1 N-6 DNA Methylase [Bradyrhizobium lablabi]